MADSATPDSTECDDAPFVPQPLECKQSQAWAGYWHDASDSSGGEQVVMVSMGDPPGEPLIASGDKRPRDDGWRFSPDAGSVAFRAWYQPRPWHLYAAPLADTGPGELRTVSGPFKVDGGVWSYAWSPDGRKIAYLADQAYDAPELWVLDLESDGYAQRVNPILEFAGGGVGSFAWSPDSRKLLYSGGLDDPEQSDLYLTDVSGPSPSPAIRLTAEIEGDIEWLAWSPDARVVAFDVGPSRDALYAARIGCAGVDGPWLITDRAGFETFTPDGDALLFLGPAADGADGEEALHRADLTMTPPVAEAATESVALSAMSQAPQWSPTAPRLAILHGRRLTVLDATTGLRYTINGPLMPDRWVQSFAWSPDGDSIAYTANHEDYFKFELYHVDISGAAPAQRRKVSPTVDHDIFVDSLTWSPDSSYLAYRANQDTAARQEIYVAERNAGILSGPVRMNVPFARDGAMAYQIRWSPDSSRLLYNSNDAGAFVVDAFVVRVAAPGEATQIDADTNANVLAWAPCPAP